MRPGATRRLRAPNTQAVRDLRYRPARLEHMFSDAFAAHSQLLRADPRRSRFLACGLLLRAAAL